ncbi:MAG TPA: hypothetical protein VIV60_10040 [Polyangiaceae bacterium]
MASDSQSGVSRIFAAIVVALATAGSCPWWWNKIWPPAPPPADANKTTTQLYPAREATPAGATPREVPHSVPEDTPKRQVPNLESDRRLYTAEIGCKDHFNSRGAQLRDAAMIVRQDRANFHEYGIRDSKDTTDLIFASPKMREELENRQVTAISPEDARTIVSRTPTIELRRLGDGYRVVLLDSGEGLENCTR